MILEIALSMALFMAPQGRRESEDRQDIEALRDLEARVETELKRWDRARKIGERQRSDGESLCEDARKGERALGLMVRSVQTVLRVLDVPSLAVGAGNEATLLLPGVE